MRRSRGPGRLEVDVDVATRIDDRGDARRLVGDQRRQMAEAVDRELRDTHRRERSTPIDRTGSPPMLDSTPAAEEPIPVLPNRRCTA